MLICPLCKNEVQEFHKRSHLLPEWMYTDCYDEKHKVLEISRFKQKVTRRQKGIYAAFICRDCEYETQLYDHYASLVLTKRSPNSIEHKSINRKYFKEKSKGEITEFERWENIDFIKFQRFVLSVILRTQFSGNMGDQIKLNDSHLYKILSIYGNDTKKDDTSYPIIVIKHPEKDKLKNQVILPYIKKQDGHHVIEFTGIGFIFNVYVSSHKKPKWVNSLRLKGDGSMFFIIMPFNETGLFNNTRRLVKDARVASEKYKPNKPVNRSA